MTGLSKFRPKNIRVFFSFLSTRIWFKHIKSYIQILVFSISNEKKVVYWNVLPNYALCLLYIFSIKICLIFFQHNLEILDIVVQCSHATKSPKYTVISCTYTRSIILSKDNSTIQQGRLLLFNLIWPSTWWEANWINE